MTSAAALAAAVLLAAPTARAAEVESCSKPAADWILISTNTTEGPQMEKKLLQHLRAELAAHHILVCGERGANSPAPIATVRIEQSGSQQVGIEVRVDDAITHKIVARQLDLTRLPPDAHAMTLALGVAELLRASWAEVNLRSAKQNAGNVPASVRDAVESDVISSGRFSGHAPATLGLRLVGEEFSHQLRQGGVDAQFALAVYNRLQLGMRFGARQALSVQASDGRVRAHSWVAGLTSGVRLTPPEVGAQCWAVGRVDAVRVQYVAEPNPNVNANAGSGTGVMGGLGIAGSVALSQTIEFIFEADAGGVFKPVRATDAGKEVMAMAGAWLSASAGMSVSLW